MLKKSSQRLVIQQGSSNRVLLTTHAAGGDALPLLVGVAGGLPDGVELFADAWLSAKARKMSKSGRASPGGVQRG